MGGLKCNRKTELGEEVKRGRDHGQSGGVRVKRWEGYKGKVKSLFVKV